MIGPADITAWALANYAELLRSIIDGNSIFPMRRDRLGRVAASEDPAAFARIVAPLWEGSKQVRGVGYTVVLEPRQRRARALQNEPVAVVIESEDDYLALTGKANEVSAFRADIEIVRQRLPVALGELRKSPAVVVANGGSWPGIVEVAQYLRDHPRPGCYVRALPVSVPTKFIESHREAIETVLMALPESGYDPVQRSFAARCGFQEESPAVRGRFLCSEARAACGFPVNDVVLRVEDWARLGVPAFVKVVICENRTNFLALPPIPGVLALWGEGGAAAGLLPRFPWLRDAKVVYWGDLDPSGLGILAGLRRSLPKVQSILMDDATLNLHSAKLLPAKRPVGAIDSSLLREPELKAYEQILEPPLGIEQEKLLFRDCLEVLAQALNTHG